MYVLQVLFSAIFIFCCYDSLKKFKNKKIAVAIEETDINEVEYPSVRICLQKILICLFFVPLSWN